MWREHPGISQPLLGLRQDAVPEMLHHVEGDHAFKHRHVHFLSDAGALAAGERHADCAGEHLAHELVAYRHRHEARLASDSRVEPGEARLALDDVIISRSIAIRASLAETGGRSIDDAGIAHSDLRVV